MNARHLLGFALAVAMAASWSGVTTAMGQGQNQSLLDAYELSESFADRTRGLIRNAPGTPTWLEDSSTFWYRKSVEGGNEFVLVDADAETKVPPFDHGRLAAGLSSAAGEDYTAVTLPFSAFTFEDGRAAIEFAIGGGGGGRRGGQAGNRWRCSLADYACSRVAAGPGGGRGRAGGRGGGQGRGGGGAGNQASEVRESPDEQWEALIQNYNVYVRPVGEPDEGVMLSTDGSEGIPYRLQSIVWSPDSTKLAAYKVRPGYSRVVHYVESSPDDQVQPKYSTRNYRKPGDAVDISYPAVFDVASETQHVSDTDLFPNPYAMTRFVWREDSRAVTFEYNQRGHEVYRVIEMDAATGQARAVVNEEADTYFCYYDKKFRHDVDDGREVIWMSERDGWNHLYLYDGATGQVKNQITSGEWVVRDVDDVDDENRHVWFRASGMHAGQDPYLVHAYRINFDGTGLVALTSADANHQVTYSDDKTYYVDTYSRVDLPPVSELRRTSDQQLVMELERADVTELEATGWQTPEVFSAKGRDGETDIWGVIIRPTNFDPTKVYPVVENIYAGPHSSFVPKAYNLLIGMNSLAELGFIVVQIDGMGTSNRSKAFHDVSWKNIKDAGFPDRILWHQAVAEQYSYYDISRVGIYGTSAGGQNSTGALLFHPDFYDAAVSAVGCHDNRMDKISWNEQFMGWPVGPEYAASSNVEFAHQLEGDLLLIVGELDNNVPPASTLQVADALIKANKTFDLLFIPGAGHGSGGAYGTRKRNDFFVHHLQGLEPPHWNSIDDPEPSTGGDIPEEHAWLFDELPEPRHLDRYWDGSAGEGQ